MFPRREGVFIRLTEDGTQELVQGRWGLVPSYHRKPLAEFKLSTNNARWEDKVRSAPTFRPSWEMGRRCLIPATWFVEPCWENNVHVPWRFARADGHLLALAGLWHTWRSPAGEQLETYTMLTINADSHSLMKRMHKPERDKAGQILPPEQQDKRMVVVIDEGEQEAWLRGTPADAAQLVSQWPAANFRAGPLVGASNGQPVSLDPTTGELF